MPTLRYAAIVSTFVVLAPAALHADDENLPAEPHWRIVLETQLKSERACQLNEVIAYQEIPLGDEFGVDGRISCIDGREFNFTRKRKHQKFSIELCAPAVC
ncbi:hypothetical protein [Hyphomicrobium sp. CS1GBMeth3]|uniref:hypothetical protein n=1 Tax=Hyphomicrobium sp. CS1GBMeth3 TaxID=1892845 RepID=UPI000B1B5B1A|nr:hypothetical protein [Hyphomicrobium sp. CS1GBMeth3]